MSGEDTVVLSANTVSEATIPISRVVAESEIGNAYDSARSRP